MMVVLPKASINSIFTLVQDTGICCAALSLHIAANASITAASPTTRYFGSGARTPRASRDLSHANTLWRPASCGATAGVVSPPSSRAAASPFASAGDGEAPFVFANRLRTLGDAGVPPLPRVVNGGAGRCRRGVEDLDSEGVPGVPGVPGAAPVPRGLGLGLAPGGTGNRRGDRPGCFCSSIRSAFQPSL